MDVVHETGEELVGLVGEPEKPEVEKNVDDLDQQWDVLNRQWMEKQQALDEALKKATGFQDELMVGPGGAANCAATERGHKARLNAVVTVMSGIKCATGSFAENFGVAGRYGEETGRHGFHRLRYRNREAADL